MKPEEPTSSEGQMKSTLSAQSEHSRQIRNCLQCNNSGKLTYSCDRKLRELLSKPNSSLIESFNSRDYLTNLPVFPSSGGVTGYEHPLIFESVEGPDPELEKPSKNAANTLAVNAEVASCSTVTTPPSISDHVKTNSPYPPELGNVFVCRICSAIFTSDRDYVDHIYHAHEK